MQSFGISVFDALVTHCLKWLDDIWTVEIGIFIKKRDAIEIKKILNMQSLKSNLGHPNLSGELNAISSDALKNDEEMKEVIYNLISACHIKFEDVLKDFSARVYFVSRLIIVDILGNLKRKRSTWILINR